jgi:hypothetical protein
MITTKENNPPTQKMKSNLLTILLAGACAISARADFNPVPIKPSSFNVNIVVPASTPVLPMPQNTTDGSECINVTAGNGINRGDNTYYEQGLYSRPGTPGGNSGVPLHNTVFTNINNPAMTFLMPPDYTQPNTLMVDTYFTPSPTPGTFLFSNPTTVTNLAVLCFGGGGGITVNYTVTHSDNSTETGTIALQDWFAGGSSVAWGANGRVTYTGGYNNYNNSAVNNNAPYLYQYGIPVTNSSPVVNVSFSLPNNSNGNHANFLAISGMAAGATTWTPIPLDPSSFNVKMIVPAWIPFGLTGTIDQGTNIVNTGNQLNTFFEQGYVPNQGNVGLPPSGSTFSSFTQPNHYYQMPTYGTNDGILVDQNHRHANVTPSTPSVFSTLAFLCAGAYDGAGMSNVCIIQHADGINETNSFFAYDWFDTSHSGAIALNVGGRINMQSRSLDIRSSGQPNLFETYFSLSDLNSAVTNIIVRYDLTNGATAYIMAISAGPSLPALVTSGPTPSPQTVFPGTGATFTVGLSGNPPVGGYWLKQVNGTFVPLIDGPTGYGSIVSGSQTTSLTITNLFTADGTNYQFMATNAIGSSSSPSGMLIVQPQTISITPAAPVAYSGNNLPLTVNLSGGPAVQLQWYYVDTLNNTNIIPGATNVTYTIPSVTTSLSNYTYGVVASNIYGTNSASVVLNISDAAAFLVSDLVPLSGEAYSGAPVTYILNANGSQPISYQWIVNGSVVSGATSNTYTLPASCGLTTIQAAYSNLLSGGVSNFSSMVALQGVNPITYTFNTNGIGWQTNGSLATISNSVLTLTINGAGAMASSAFLTNAIYVGGVWNASYTYNSHGGGADGTAFILQNATNAFALGGSGSGVGYSGLNSNSIAFIINLYGANGETPGIGLTMNGQTAGSSYSSAAPVDPTGTNDIYVTLTYSNGVLAAKLKDSVTLATFSTNYNIGPLAPILGANVAYVGFGGACGGVTSFQTVSNFQFQTILPPVALTVSHGASGSLIVSWPAADPNYQLQISSSLSSPASWIAGPTPTLVNGTNQVVVQPTGTGHLFYRLLRANCQ